jgi:hypothetical protein
MNKSYCCVQKKGTRIEPFTAAQNVPRRHLALTFCDDPMLYTNKSHRNVDRANEQCHPR